MRLRRFAALCDAPRGAVTRAQGRARRAAHCRDASRRALDVRSFARQDHRFRMKISESTEESEQPRKVVGHRRPPKLLDPTTDTRERAREWRRAFPTPFVPKGVYRFSSHEEAKQWLTEMLTRRR